VSSTNRGSTQGRIGILGGTFDPIHRGHLDVAGAAHDALALDEVWIVPLHVPPHRPQPVASPFHRFAMAALAAGSPETPWLLASDMELAQEGPSYTALTLARIGAMGYAPSQLFFLAGADAFAEIAAWRDYPALLDLSHFVVLSRPGFPAGTMPLRVPELAPRMIEAGPGRPIPPQPSILLLDTKTTDVSSSEVRRRLKSGAPLEGRVPAAVERHVIRHGLYRA
jgi:nicotinate-nucleotide adenylyltransferase